MSLSFQNLRDGFRWWIAPAIVLFAPFCLPLTSVAGVISQTGCGYSSGVPLEGTYGGTSYHCTSVTGFDTTSITASALTDDQSIAANGQYQISDSADLDAMIFTSGPVRSGFMEITAASTSEFGFIFEQVGSWNCYGVGSPCFSAGNQYIPVTLGLPLELTIQVDYTLNTGSAAGSIGLSLFEATPLLPPPGLGGDAVSADFPLVPGAPVVLLSAPPVPEPGTVLLLVAGLGVFCVKARFRKI
jgi:PEP-CTERM motif